MDIPPCLVEALALVLRFLFDERLTVACDRGIVYSSSLVSSSANAVPAPGGVTLTSFF